MLFADRRDAGRRLAARLAEEKLTDPVVIALPRGGVPVAAEIARALNAPIDLVIVRKLGLPGHEELAAGAIAEGEPPIRVISNDVLRAAGMTEEALAPVIRRETAELERRRETYLGGRPRVPVTGRTVILVDDGIATGATMKAALRATRRQAPGRLVVAVPVAAPDAIAEIGHEADQVLCLSTPQSFMAVGVHYADFGQTQDAEVIAALREPGASDAER